MRVKTVLQHLEIERRHVNAAEVVEGVVNQVKLKLLVSFQAFPNQAGCSRQCPTIDLDHVVVSNRIRIRIEKRAVHIQLIAQIAQQVAAGVSNLPISYAQPVEQLVKNPDIF